MSVQIGDPHKIWGSVRSNFEKVMFSLDAGPWNESRSEPLLVCLSDLYGVGPVLCDASDFIFLP